MTTATDGGFKDLLRFLGRRVLVLLAWGAAAGLALSAVELAFAYGLQAFLMRVGVMAASAAKLPAFLERLDLSGVLAFIVAAGLLRAGLYWAQIYLNGAAQAGLHQLQRSRLLRWVYHAPSAGAGEVFNLFNARVEAASLMAGGIQGLASQLTSALPLALYLLWLAPKLTVILGAAMCAILPALRWADARTRVAGESQAAEWQKLSFQLMTGVKNLVLLQIYGTQERERERSQRSLDATHRHNLDHYRVLGFKVALPQALGVVLVCVVALLPSGEAARGVLVAYLYLFLRLVQTFSLASQAMSAVIVNRPQALGLMSWWRAHERETVPRQIVEAEPFAEPVGWKLSGVRFTFPGAAGPVVDGLSLSIAAGSAAALVGASGSGKSTLIGLLLGTLSPDAGTVALIDGAGARPLTAQQGRLLRSVGYVGPESFLIEGTIRENLLYGLGREPSDRDLDEALRQAECGFAFELPDGLRHRLTEQGHGLSAGQKQRLSLARALLRRPTVLILDEATANLDAATESRLVATFARLKGKMTIVAATHREALLSLADQTVRLGV